MKLLAGGCRLYSPEDGEVVVEGTRTTRSVISPASGAKRITQAVSAYSPGVSAPIANPDAEEVLYVAAGVGTWTVDGVAFRMRPGNAIFIPPGATYNIASDGPGEVQIISSRCPVQGEQGTAPAMVHEDDREEIRAGQDRVFHYLVHTDLGSKQVTQFVGWIPESKAPFHWHPYEEAIYILEGRGILHLEAQSAASEFGPGSSIYLPDHVVHCLENPGPAPVRLLGVFYPSGSASEAYEND